MSSNRKIARHPSLASGSSRASLVERKDEKTTNSSFARERKISDPWSYGIHGPFNNLQRSSRFPMMAPRNATEKKADGVIFLNTEREKKYLSRTQSYPTAQYTGNASRVPCQAGTFNRDLKRAWSFSSRLGQAKNVEGDNFEERSFCDSLSSVACSSIMSRPRSSSFSFTNNEDCFLSKRNDVLFWLIRSTE